MKVETAASKSALVLGLSLRKKAFSFDQSISKPKKRVAAQSAATRFLGFGLS